MSKMLILHCDIWHIGSIRGQAIAMRKYETKLQDSIEPSAFFAFASISIMFMTVRTCTSCSYLSGYGPQHGGNYGASLSDT